MLYGAWLTLALVTYTRLTRVSPLDVMGEDYIRTARAKGMPRRRVVMVHALRPGLGWTVLQAINQQDLPIIVGIVVLAAAFVVLVNVLVDIGYALLDPRVRLH